MAAVQPIGGRDDTISYRSVSTGLISLMPPGSLAPGMVPIGGLNSSLGVPSLAHSEQQMWQPPPSQQQQAQVAVQMRPLLGETKHKYSRLNLTTSQSHYQHGEYNSSPGVPLVKAHRPISMFWQEKLGLLLFFIQIHALIWLECYEFYPKNWREYWRWTLIFILDVHNLIKDAGGSNTGGDTAFHTVCVLLLPIVSLILYEFLSRTIYKDRIAGSIHEDRHMVSYLTFQKWSLLFAEQLYIPTILVWFRMWTCDSSNHITYIYRNWSCWGGGHIAMIIIISIISGFFMIGLPLVIWKRMKRIVVFHDAATHERYLQSRELEYIMGCNNLYEYTYFFYIGSFTRFWAWTRLFQLLQKLLLCLFLISLNHFNTGNSGLIPQAILFLVIISGPVVLNIFYRSYRCASSNYLKAILDGILFFTCVMNVIEADPNGFNSSFIDQYTFSDMLLLINLVGLGFAGILCGYNLFKERRPANSGRDIFWPVKETDLLSLHLAHPEMLVALNTGKRMLEEGMNIPEEFYPRQNLLDAVNAMRTLLAEAKARREGKIRRSLLEDRSRHRVSHRQLTREEELELIASLKLGEEKSRALEWTLQDMVEDLSLLYNTITARVKSAAGGSSGGLTQELSRFERIKSSFEGFAEDLSQKSKERAFMHPLKRDFLAKMLIIRGIVLTGNENFIYGERVPWSEPKYLPSLIDEEEEQRELQRQREKDKQEFALQQQQLQLQQQLQQQQLSSSPSVRQQHPDEMKINILPGRQRSDVGHDAKEESSSEDEEEDN